MAVLLSRSSVTDSLNEGEEDDSLWQHLIRNSPKQKEECESVLKITLHALLDASLCHRVVDGLCGREPPHRGDYRAAWSVEEWLELLRSLTAVFCLAVRNNSSDEEVLAGLSDVGSSHAENVLSVLRARRQEICRALLDKTNSISPATLQDFDWQLKLVLSSDKISSLHIPLLTLSLDVRENGALRPVTVEMNKEELNTLISSLESANKVVLQLK